MDSIEERFWTKVDKTGECWVWTAGVRSKRDGYGTFKCKGQNVPAHRFSYALKHGPIPDGLWVLHHCDNPPCVRPDHLWLGTATDNDADRHMKGRSRGGRTNRARGSRNGWAKLTEEDVLSIRRRWASGETQTSIGLRFKTPQTNVSKIVRHLAWTHV